MMRTSNPALNDNVFQNAVAGALAPPERMTLVGTVNKTGILVLLAIVSAAWPWMTYFKTVPPEGGMGNPAVVVPMMLGGAIGGLICGLVLMFKRDWAAFLAPAYALLEGLFLGGISALYQAQYAGIVVQAVGLTLFTLVALLLVYRSGLIKVTDNFRLGVAAATGGIMLLYLVGFVLSFFGKSIPYIHESGLIGIGFSLLVVAIASMNLVLDFDFIERGADSGAPKYMEWFAAFGLMVTLVWLYLEFLRLLAKLNNRR
jgi:uncharacterized YccA/Bax inhibitor family protein